MSLTRKQIIERWDTRVVPNNWHKLGAEGAAEYIKKYGRNIGYEKLAGLADYAREKGYIDFAEYIELFKDVKSIS